MKTERFILPSNLDIWKVAFPIIIGLLAENVIGVINTAFLAHVGEIELGASALGGTFFTILFVVGMGFSIGTQIMISRKIGEKKNKDVGQIVENCLYFLLLLALCIIFFVETSIGPLLKKIVSHPDIATQAASYLTIRVYGLIFVFINISMRTFFIGVQSTKHIGISSFLMAATNVFFDYTLIFGNWGFPQLGIEGAAYASVIAEGVAAIYFIVLTFTGEYRQKYHLFAFKKPDWQILKVNLDLSFFMMLQHAISLSSWFVFFLIIEKSGTLNLATANIVRSIYILMILPVWAYSSTVSTFVSAAFGAHKASYTPHIIKRVAKISLLTSIVTSALILLFPHAILRLYTTDPYLTANSYHALFVIAIANICSAVATIPYSAISATGNTRKALLIELCAIGLYLLTVEMATVHFPTRPELAWCAEITYFLTLFIACSLFLRYGNWQKSKLNKQIY